MKISPIIKNNSLLLTNVFSKNTSSISFCADDNLLDLREKVRTILGDDFESVVDSSTLISPFGVQLLEMMNNDVIKKSYSKESNYKIKKVLNASEEDSPQMSENIRLLNYFSETKNKKNKMLLDSFSTERFGKILLSPKMNVDIRINIAERLKETKAPLRAGFSHIFTDGISLSAYNFFMKLNDKVVETFFNSPKKSVYTFLPDMLGLKKSKFHNVDYNKLDSNAEFINSLSNKKISNGGTALDYITNLDFLIDEKFDTNKITGILDYILPLVQNSNYKDSATLHKLFDMILISNEEKIARIDNLFNAMKQKQFSSFNVNDLQVLFDVSSKIGMDECLSVYYKYSQLKDSKGDYIFTDEDLKSIPKQTLLHLNKVSTNEEEVQNIDRLIKLIQLGYVDKHVFSYLPEEGYLNPCIVKDVDILTNAIEKGIEPIDVIAPLVTSEEEGLSKVNVGDAFQLNTEDFIRIKLNDSKSSLMKINRETYSELFPLVERFASTQNKIGNCWEVAGFNSVFTDPKERSVIVSLFSNVVDENGNISDDIEIHFPSSKHEGYIFKNGEFPDSLNTDYYSCGSKGMQMLELAHSEALQYNAIDEVIERYEELIEDTEDSRLREKKKSKLERIHNKAESREERKSHIFWVDPIENEPFVFPIVSVTRFDNAYEEKRNGGSPATLYEMLGYKNVKTIKVSNTSCLDVFDMLYEPQTYENNIVSIGTKKVRGGNHFVSLDERKGIVMGHAYRLTLGKVEDGLVKTVNVVNPWGVSDVEITPVELLRYINNLYLAKRQNLDG